MNTWFLLLGVLERDPERLGPSHLDGTGGKNVSSREESQRFAGARSKRLRLLREDSHLIDSFVFAEYVASVTQSAVLAYLKHSDPLVRKDREERG
jgi:hypothetical protein